MPFQKKLACIKQNAVIKIASNVKHSLNIRGLYIIWSKVCVNKICTY